MFTNKITIAIPVYERYDFFEEALNSAIDQTVSCNIIVVDNCSINPSFQIFVESLSYPNIQYYKNSYNVGMVGNWNRCVDLVKTEWITILHDDDALMPEFIENYLRVLNSTSSEVLCIACECAHGSMPSAFLKKRTVATKLKYRTFYTEEFLYTNLSSFPGIAFKKNIEGFLGFKEVHHPIADLDYWVRISKIGAVLKFSTKSAFYRISDKQTSFSVFEKITQQSYLYRKYEVGYPNFIKKYMSIVFTLNQIRIYKKNYKVNIKLEEIFEADDLLWSRVIEFAPIFWLVLSFSYITYIVKYYLRKQKVI